MKPVPLLEPKEYDTRSSYGNACINLLLTIVQNHIVEREADKELDPGQRAENVS